MLVFHQAHCVFSTYLILTLCHGHNELAEALTALYQHLRLTGKPCLLAQLLIHWHRLWLVKLRTQQCAKVRKALRWSPRKMRCSTFACPVPLQLCKPSFAPCPLTVPFCSLRTDFGLYPCLPTCFPLVKDPCCVHKLS